MESTTQALEASHPGPKRAMILREYNWRYIGVRILVNALTLVITAALTPDLYFVSWTLRNVLFMAVLLGVINALLRPIIQFLTLPLIFATYGVVVVLINAGVLFILAWLFPGRFQVLGFGAALWGGLILGIVSTVLESLFGLTMPVVPPEQAELRRRIEERPWRSPEAGEAPPEGQA